MSMVWPPLPLTVIASIAALRRQETNARKPWRSRRASPRGFEQPPAFGVGFAPILPTSIINDGQSSLSIINFADGIITANAH
jgi:hypothetical protein